MSEVTEKSYDPKKFRRKIPKVSRSYKRHSAEKKTFHKGDNINDLIENLFIQESNMSIESEMDTVAKSMADANQDPKEATKQLIKSLGPEGLKKAFPDLSDEQKTLLKSVLEDMSKSVSMDDVYDGDRKFITHDNMGTELEDGSDDEDEKLVKPEAATINHQGNRDPEGIDEHVIKGRGPDKAPRKKKGSSYGTEGGKYSSPAAEGEAAARADNAKARGEKPYKAPQNPAAEGEAAARADTAKAKETSMTKSKEELTILKDKIVKSYEDAGLSYTEDLIKSEMKKRLLKEESQVVPSDQTTGGKKDKADKPTVPDIEEGKNASTKADDVKISGMAKSIVYDSPNKKLAACTGGRNHHFSMNGYYDEVLRKAAIGDEGEKLEKSEDDKEANGINDLIEKGLDRDADTCKTEQLFKSQNTGDMIAKSFEDTDMIDAMNMSDEEAEKILGK